MQSSSSNMPTQASRGRTCCHACSVQCFICSAAVLNYNVHSKLLVDVTSVAFDCQRTVSGQHSSSSLYIDSVNWTVAQGWMMRLLKSLLGGSRSRQHGRCRLLCTCTTCHWLNGRVLRNIGGQMHPRARYIHRYIDSPRRRTLSWSMWGSLSDCAALNLNTERLYRAFKSV